MGPKPGPRIAPLILAVLVAGLSSGWAEAGEGAPPARYPERGEGKMRVVTREKAVEVAVGERIDLVVTRPVAIPSELRYAWPATPAIEGRAVRFLRLRIEGPPPDVDGGVTVHHYELEAVEPGTARVRLAPRASSAAVPPPVELAVTVRRDAARSLAELVRELAEAVAAFPRSPLDLARTFGEVESDSEGAVYVKPSDPRLKRVVVVKRRETGELNDVELELATPGSLAVSELEAVWGPPGLPPPLAIETRTLIFRPAAPAGARFRATVALVVDGDESGPVLEVKVIRDIP